MLHPIDKPRKPYLKFSSFIYVGPDIDAFQKSPFGFLFLKTLPTIALLHQKSNTSRTILFKYAKTDLFL